MGLHATEAVAEENLCSVHSCEHCQPICLDTGVFEATLRNFSVGVGAQCPLYLEIGKCIERLKSLDGDLHEDLAEEGFPDCSVMLRGSLDRSLLMIKELEIGKNKLIQQVWIQFYMLCPQDDPAARFLRMRPVRVQPGSGESLALVRGWFDTCRLKHTLCKKQMTKYTPSRLIQISHAAGKRRLQLRKNAPGTPPYAALSYCWGGEQKSKTTRERERAYLEGIPEYELPRSIRDAVDVTQALGLSFLWVDALCILQDDDVDKATEISYMPKIYNAAAVTISASRASRSADGFLGPRRRMGLFRLKFELDDGTYGSAVLFPFADYSNDEEPLNCRAWAMQESLLSDRILDFGTMRTQWFCREYGAYDGWEPTSDMHTKGFRISMDRGLEPGREKGPDSPDLYTWWQVVEHYSQLALTDPLDRLPAISALAERYAAILGDEYVAGLWRSALPGELLWERRRLEAPQKRPVKYQGPSWSWAGMAGGVRAPSRKFMSIPSLRILDCRCELAVQIAKFGMVKSARITAEGHIRRALWLKGQEPQKTGSYFNLAKEDDASALLPGSMTADCLEDELLDPECSSIPVYLLEVVQNEGRGQFHTRALVLREISAGVYSRLGTFHVSHCLDRELGYSHSRSEAERAVAYFEFEDWLQAEKRVVTIV